VSKDGYILTNNHVVADAEKVTVNLLDKRSFAARVIGRDPTTDVALIKIDGTNLPAVNLGNDETTRVGQWVLAIGNPLGLDFTVTAGIISAKGRGGGDLGNLLGSNYAITDFIQTDAAINPGNSGGPLVNIRGEVIGINSAIASSTGYYAGYGFAIPITLAKQVMNDLIAHGKVRRAVLGVSIRDVTAENAQAAGLKEIRGVLVNSFSDDASPAKAAGVQEGDVIVAVDGKPVDRVSTLQRVVRGYKPGDVVPVDIVRFGDRKTVRVRLAEAPSEEPATVASRDPSGTTSAEPTGRTYEKLGLTVTPVPAELITTANIAAPYRNGLLVTDVAAPGPAYRKVFERQDIILQILSPGARRDVKTPADLERAISSLKPGDTVTLLLYNFGSNGQGQTHVETLRVGG
jgi:serine protease Do